jgi:hypothetical protein
MDKKNLTHCKHIPCNTLTHSTNEDLLNIKRKGDQIGDDFFLGPNLVSFNRTVVPYETSKVNFRVEKKFLSQL